MEESHQHIRYVANQALAIWQILVWNLVFQYPPFRFATAPIKATIAAAKGKNSWVKPRHACPK